MRATQNRKQKSQHLQSSFGFSFRAALHCKQQRAKKYPPIAGASMQRARDLRVVLPSFALGESAPTRSVGTARKRRQLQTRRNSRLQQANHSSRRSLRNRRSLLRRTTIGDNSERAEKCVQAQIKQVPLSPPKIAPPQKAASEEAAKRQQRCGKQEAKKQQKSSKKATKKQQRCKCSSNVNCAPQTKTNSVFVFFRRFFLRCIRLCFAATQWCARALLARTATEFAAVAFAVRSASRRKTRVRQTHFRCPQLAHLSTVPATVAADFRRPALRSANWAHVEVIRAGYGANQFARRELRAHPASLPLLFGLRVLAKLASKLGSPTAQCTRSNATNLQQTCGALQLASTSGEFCNLPQSASRLQLPLDLRVLSSVREANVFARSSFESAQKSGKHDSRATFAVMMQAPSSSRGCHALLLSTRKQAKLDYRPQRRFVRTRTDFRRNARDSKAAHSKMIGFSAREVGLIASCVLRRSQLTSIRELTFSWLVVCFVCVCCLVLRGLFAVVLTTHFKDSSRLFVLRLFQSEMRSWENSRTAHK